MAANGGCPPTHFYTSPSISMYPLPYASSVPLYPSLNAPMWDKIKSCDIKMKRPVLSSPVRYVFKLNGQIIAQFEHTAYFSELFVRNPKKYCCCCVSILYPGDTLVKSLIWHHLKEKWNMGRIFPVLLTLGNWKSSVHNMGFVVLDPVCKLKNV